MSILVVGSVALDSIKTPLARCRDVLGGSATYFSMAARHFSPVSLVAVVGTDFPAGYARLLERKGIDTSGLMYEKGKTFRWEGEYGWDFQNPKTIATHLNVFSHFNPSISARHKKCRNVFLANIDPRIQEAVRSHIKSPRLVACDTMNYWIESKRSRLVHLLKKMDIFFLNESEARELTGESSIVKAAKYIRRMGPQAVIIKKGEHGSLLFADNYVFSVPAYLLENLYDPTGAGDTFAGAVMGCLAGAKRLNRRALKMAVVYGTIMSTFAVESFSLKRLASVTKSDIEKRLRLFRKLTLF